MNEVAGDEKRRRQPKGATPRHARIAPAGIEDMRLGDATFRVLCYLLACQPDGDGYCSASCSKIAKAFGIARSTVSGHISALIGLRYIIKRPALRADGGRAANQYLVAPYGCIDLYSLSEIPTGVSADAAQESPGPPTQRSLLLSLNGSANPAVGISDSPLSDQPTAPAGPEMTGPCQPRADTHKEQTIRTNLFPERGARARAGNRLSGLLSGAMPDTVRRWAK